MKGTEGEFRRSDPRLRLAYDLYNQGLTQALAVTSAEYRGAATEARLEAGTLALPFGTLDVTVDPAGLSWGGYELVRFESTTDLEVRGLRNRYLRAGPGHGTDPRPTRGLRRRSDLERPDRRRAAAARAGYESELIVNSPHSCQGKPEVIEEVRSILLEQPTLP